MNNKKTTNKEKKIILLVEDDEVLLRALYLFFQKDKYTIASAVDGDTAVKMAQRLKPNIIILDLLLPKMNGFEFLEAIKSMPDLKNIPVVVLSNLSNTQDIKKAKSLGAKKYFIKSDTELSVLSEEIKNII